MKGERDVKKRFVIALCLLLGCVFLAGCPRLESEETVPPTETAEPTEWIIEAEEEEKRYEGLELTFLPIWQEASPEAAVLNQAAEVFELRTGCRVQIIWNGTEEEIADIYQLHGDQLPDYAGQLLDLTEMAAAAGYADKSFQSLTDQVVGLCGFLGAIPQSPYVTGFYYNTEAFETSGVIQAPRNWERFVSVCTLLQTGGYQGLTFGSEDADDLLLMHLTGHLGAEEVQRLMAEGGWDSEAVLAAVTEIFDFAMVGNLAAGTPAGTNRVATSNSAIAYGTNALCAQAEQAALADLSWGMFPYPGAGEAEPAITVRADVLAVSAACAQSQAAFDFIMLLTTGEFDQLRSDVTIGIPADPRNASPIEGAVDALKQARILEVPQPNLTEKQVGYILKLFKSKYETPGEFLKEMQGRYR